MWVLQMTPSASQIAFVGAVRVYVGAGMRAGVGVDGSVDVGARECPCGRKHGHGHGCG